MKDFRKNIFIFTVLLTVFLCSSAIGQQKEPDMKDIAWIGGKVIWDGHDLTKATVSVYKDPQFKELYTKGLLLRPEGDYTLRIDHPGKYYIVAFVDDNANNEFDMGDGMGIYGVRNWSDQKQQAIPLDVEAGAKIPDVDIEILALVNEQGSTVPISLAEVSTGIQGKVILPNHVFSNTIVFVYSDPTWNNRVAQTEVREDGEYQISIPPGKYYLLAVIDENNTNLLDVGDKFGIWGMTRFDIFPKAVKVEESQLTRDRNILIIGKIDVAGRPIPLQGLSENQASDMLKSEDKIIVPGNVIWSDGDIKTGMVQVYSDPSMTVSVAQSRIDNTGKFTIAVPPGDYFIVAVVDKDGDGKYSTGDGIGVYGAADAANELPKKFTVTDSAKDQMITILITAEFDDSGQLKPMDAEKTLAQYEPEWFENESSGTGISGKIIWEGRSISEATLIMSNDPRFENGIRIPVQVDETGSYKCSTPPGDYYLMALVAPETDAGTENIAGRGIYGIGYSNTHPQKISVFKERITAFINIKITELLMDDGGYIPFVPPGIIRSRHGEPDDIVSEEDAQEWWYWNKGVSFTFEKTQAGWNLTDTYEFNPKNVKDKSEETVKTDGKTKGNIYYTFDGSIWGVNMDGTDRRWIAPGTHPTASIDGKRLLFPDTQGDIYLLDMDNEASPQVILKRRDSALQPAISYDGKAIAFARNNNGHRQIFLKNLETGEESPIPGGSMSMYNPTWSPDDELVAYSASSIAISDQKDINRDIYYYDLVSDRTERVSTSQSDDFNPVWSPDQDKRVLVYCRSEEGHAQLWMVNFDADGKPIEEQLTKYGGNNPAWSPSGNKIIYENNGQLWTINPDGSLESPILVDEEPVFGTDPFWTQ
jgi:Tol biopolymer transport system component